MADSKTNASKLIDERIRELGDWRGKTLGKVRGIIKEADPEIVEEWKWVQAHEPRNTSLVPQRRYLYWRDLQERGQADILQGCVR